MIELLNVSKSYGDKKVLVNINTTIEKGKIYGLLGRNGVGKTTLLKMMSNQLYKYDGEIKLDGDIVRENYNATQKVLYVHENLVSFMFDSQKLSKIFKECKELLDNWDEEYKDRLVKEFDLDEKTKFNKLSKGNKNLVSLIIGLASNTEIVFFDEPSTGLDANNRYKFYNLLMEDVEEKGRTAIISTHIIDEAENVFEEVMILDNTELKLKEEVATIQSKGLTLTGKEEVLRKVIDSKKVIDVEAIGGLKMVSIFDELTNDEKDELLSNGVDISKLSLQKFFVHFTNSKEVK